MSIDDFPRIGLKPDSGGRGDQPVKQVPNLHELSIRVRGCSDDLRALIEEFAEGPRDQKEAENPTPLLDPVSDVSNNLHEAERQLILAHQSFVKLKQRIRD